MTEYSNPSASSWMTMAGNNCYKQPQKDPEVDKEDRWGAIASYAAASATAAVAKEMHSCCSSHLIIKGWHFHVGSRTRKGSKGF